MADSNEGNTNESTNERNDERWSAVRTVDISPISLETPLPLYRSTRSIFYRITGIVASVPVYTPVVTILSLSLSLVPFLTSLSLLSVCSCVPFVRSLVRSFPFPSGPNTIPRGLNIDCDSDL